MRAYTLSEIRNGTGWAKGVLFVEVSDARLELEGNPVFTDLRMQRDALLETADDFCNELLNDLTPQRIADYRAQFRTAMRRS